MSELNNVVINDGAATPVAHTFKPRNVAGGIATLVESTGVPLADKRLTLSIQRTASSRVKPTVKLQLPVVQDATVNGVTKPTIVRTAYCDLTFNFDPSSSTQERKDMIAQVRNLLADDQTMVHSALVDLEDIWG